MSERALRQACEELFLSLPMWHGDCDDEGCVSAILRFAQRQQAATWREIDDILQKQLSYEDAAIDAGGKNHPWHRYASTVIQQTISAVGEAKVKELES